MLKKYLNKKEIKMPIGRFCPECGKMIGSDVLPDYFKHECKYKLKKLGEKNDDKDKKELKLPKFPKKRFPYDKF